MPVTKPEAQMLSTLGVACRPHGASQWDHAGVMTAIGRVAHMSLADVMMTVARAAADRNLETPAAIGNPSAPCWRERVAGASRPHPLKAGEDCPRHLGQPAANCGGCRADQLAEDKPPSPEPSWVPGDTAAGVRAARDALRAVRSTGVVSNNEEGTQ